MLQWVRGPITAVMGVSAWLSPVVASMGPRSDNRGYGGSPIEPCRPTYARRCVGTFHGWWLRARVSSQSKQTRLHQTHLRTHSHSNFEKNFCLPKQDTKLHPSMLPSRLELKRPEGSGSAAPL